MRPSAPQAAALLYLLVPTALFLAFFGRYLLAVPGLAFVAWATWRYLHWGVANSFPRPVAAALLVLACAMVAASGVLPPMFQPSDYSKHYAILHLLIEHHWPVVIDVGQGPEVLRYYLGWYLVPAAVCKLLGAGAIDWVLATWTALGLWLVFLLLAEALQVVNRWWAVAAVLIFMCFSGADQLGAALTGHVVGYSDHYEWWASYYQFPSLITDLVWAPQHGLSAWLALGLLLDRAAARAILPHVGLLFFATFFWSPFCALGCVPFVLLSAREHGFRKLLSTSNLLSVPALGPVLFGYLFSSTPPLMHAWVFTLPGWTLENLLAFWLLEFGLFALLISLTGTARKSSFVVAVTTLLLVPLFAMGGQNDFSMRVSTASLAVLAFLVAELIVSKPWRATFPLVLALLLGIGTPYAEFSRGFRWRANPQGRVGKAPLLMSWRPTNPFRVQYLAPYPNWFLRSSPLPEPEPEANPEPSLVPPVAPAASRRRRPHST